MRYNHYIIEDRLTGQRSEVIKRGTLADTPKYKVIACCGYHEEPKKNRGLNNDKN